MKFICDSKYIVFPVNHNEENKTLLFKNGGDIIFDLQIPIDYSNPHYNAYINVERFNGIELELSCADNFDFELQLQKSDIKYANEDIYGQLYRPAFHFSAVRGWLNDPNGLFYYNGQYHMFFQHNPVSRNWGNMHWGHAVSPDLIHWCELECAIYPNKFGTAFSGSAVVDYNNVSNLKSGENPPILLFYTAAGGLSKLSEEKNFTQCLAFSTDGGNTFTDYTGNPIIDNIAEGNRDPKVEYDREGERYIMTLFLDNDRYAFFKSKNLIEWEKFQEINVPEENECPDFYPLTINNEIKWIFSGAHDRYLIGTFNGTRFDPQTKLQQLHYGNNSYASQTWHGDKYGRRLRISWNTFEIPDMPFNKSMTFPCEMTLMEDNDEIYLCANPIDEIKNLYLSSQEYNNLENGFSCILDSFAYDIEISISKLNSEIEINFFGINIKIIDDSLYCCGCSAPLWMSYDRCKLRILADKTGVEIFIDKGQKFLSCGMILDYNLNQFYINGELLIENLKIHSLKSVF